MGKYDNIINLPHHVSKNHKAMNLLDRAAQFAPFSALDGYDDAIKEQSRITIMQKQISEEDQEIINYKLKYLINNKNDEEITIVYFVADTKKNGRLYKTYTGIVTKIDDVEKNIYFEDKTIIKISNIIEIKSLTLNKLFDHFDF